MQPRAVIFDVDGVLVDSYHAHFKSWRKLAREHAIEITEQQFARGFGRTSRDNIREHFSGAALSDAQVQEFVDRKESLYREILEQDFPSMPGAIELIDDLKRAGFRLAVGSSGPPPNVEVVLEKLGRSHSFDAMVTGEDVTKGKPEPQVFLIAAERLGVPPARCIVIEDAPPGIVAARRAGMASVAIASTGRTVTDFDDVDPDLVIRRLSELDPDSLLALLAV